MRCAGHLSVREERAYNFLGADLNESLKQGRNLLVVLPSAAPLYYVDFL